MNNTDVVKRGLKRRYAKEKRFQFYGLCAVMVGFIFLALLLIDIVIKAWPAFSVTEIRLDIDVSRASLDLPAEGRISEDAITAVNFGGVIKRSLRDAFPEVTARKDRRDLYRLVSSGAEFSLLDKLTADPGLVGETPLRIWFKADDDVDTFYKLGSRTSRISDLQVEIIAQLEAKNSIRTAFNTTLFTASDSREPEQAGIRGALMGSFWTLLVTLLVSLPVGIAAAIYLEEFAPRNRLTDFIEININNLAAVPSIVFGLLGLAVFINFFGMPRSVSRYSSIFSACRARRRWSAAWCCR